MCYLKPQGQPVIFREICTLYPGCSIENVEVECGESSRRKRSTYSHEVIILFDFILTNTFNPAQTPAEMDDATYNEFSLLTDFIQNQINSGGLDIAGLEIDPSSFRFAESLIICQAGEVAEYTTFTCSKSIC